MEYYSLNQYLRNTFGQKLYKLSLNGGMTCPNRDGTLSADGCIFCSKGGSGEFAASADLSITEQIEQAKLRVAKKIKSGKYIAYFQAYTNTYAPIDYLEKIFTQAILHPDIEVLSIATRPDCLPEETLSLLSRLNKIKPVWVELGLQTIHPQTARLINRCYPLEAYDTAVRKLHEIGIQAVTHVILGLPGETEKQMLQTVSYVGNMTDGIKLQLLHILRGTKLEEMYLRGEVKTLSMEEYLGILKNALNCSRKMLSCIA